MAKAKAADTPVTSIKGFDADLKCRGFQFEVGKTYNVTGTVKACSNGFHACDNPFDVWNYYPIIDSDGRLARYAEVVQSGTLDRDADDSKIASAEITIKAEIALPDFIKRAVAAVIALTKGKDEAGDHAQIGSSGYHAKIGSSGYHAQIGSSGDHAKIGSSGYHAKIGSSGDGAQIGSSGDHAKIGSSGYHAKIGSSGYHAQIGSSGDHAQIGSSGYHAKIGSSGYHAQIGSSGYHAKIGSSGYHAQIGSSGDHAKIGSSGYHAKIGSSGDGAQIGSSGDHAKIVASGNKAVVVAAGKYTTFSGALGAAVCLTEYDDNGDFLCFVTGRVGENGLKPDTPYRAQDGKFVEAA